MARRLVLDSGAVLAYAHGDRRVVALLKVAAEARTEVAVPPVVVAETVRGGPHDAVINRLLHAVRVTVVGLRVGRLAGELLGAAGMSAAADALIMAEAVRGGPCTLLTSDPDDMTRLAGGRPYVSIARL